MTQNTRPIDGSEITCNRTAIQQLNAQPTPYLRFPAHPNDGHANGRVSGYMQTVEEGSF